MPDNDNDHNELRLKQMELFAARQMFDELNARKSAEFYIQQQPLSSIDDDDFTLRDYNYQRLGLELLVAKKLIRVLNADELIKTGIHISVVDVLGFKSFYQNLYESIPSTGNGARIIYSTRTGRGKVNGNIFRLNRRSRNRKVFEYLAKRPNQYVSKNKLWVIAGEKGKFDAEEADNVIIFNDIIQSLREALKNISPKQLRLKKRVILDAEVTLTD
ncbi:hypothetical protein KC992_00300 [Candidatus Saccharibacteria bacterium]|nr:hypothetical protein [Candidatus Saccharibacteria bacterium]